MDKLKKYRELTKKLFFISINKNNFSWSNNSDLYLYSNYYSNNNQDSRFKIDLHNKKLFISPSRGSDIFICSYSIFKNIKVFFHVIKIRNILKHHQKNIDNNHIIANLKIHLNIIEKNYIKEIRKEKITKLK